MDKKQSPVYTSTSWDPVGHWYGKLVGQKGHYFHQNVIIPKSLALLKLSTYSRLLDIACGSGVLCRYLPKTVSYVGIDTAFDLIQLAGKLDKNQNHQFIEADATYDLPLAKTDFTHASIILALQNIKNPEAVIKNTGKHLNSGGHLLLVLNHPCFRIPRQSGWEIDNKNKMQYRRINRYLSSLMIPINMHPGQKNSLVTWSFHHPLSFYSQYLYQNHFLIEKIEEWTSDKESVGKAAKMENRARSEFPLFLAILAVKKL